MKLYNSELEKFGASPESIQIDNSKWMTTQEKEHKRMQKDIDEWMAKTGIPPCHINFGNIGDLDFDWLNVKPPRLNLKLFRKLDALSKEVKIINNVLIKILQDLNCCDVAKSYNDNVLPIFEWLLDDFIKGAIGIAENLITSYQGFKLIACVFRPVPGNPWLKSGGYDWMNYIWSLIEGFDSVCKWILNGNLVDLLLTPVKEFSDKLQSCLPKSDNINEIMYTLNTELMNPNAPQSQALHNQFLVEKGIVSGIYDIEDINRECPCLTAILGSFDIEHGENITISKLSDIESKLKGKILYADKNRYNKALKDLKSDDLTNASVGKFVMDDLLIKDYPDLIVNLDNAGVNEVSRAWNKNRELLKAFDEGDLTTHRFPFSSYSLGKTTTSYDENNEFQKSTGYMAKRFLYFDGITNLVTQRDMLDGEYTTMYDYGFSNIFPDISVADWTTLFSDNKSKMVNVQAVIELNERRIRLRNKLETKKSKKMKLAEIEESHLRVAWQKMYNTNMGNYNMQNTYKATGNFSAVENSYDALQDSLTGQIVVDRIGHVFNVTHFVNFLSDPNNETYLDQGPVLATNNGETAYDPGAILADHVEKYKEYTLYTDLHMGAISRLNILIAYNNTDVKVLGNKLEICGCDIICKLLQMIVDIIIQAINEFLEAIVMAIVNMIMGEKLSYILKYILDKFKCFLMAAEMEDNLKRIEMLSERLQNENELKMRGMVDQEGNPVETIPGLKRMVDLIDCELEDEDEIDIVIDQVVATSPSWNPEYSIPSDNVAGIIGSTDGGVNTAVPVPPNFLLKNVSLTGEMTTTQNVASMLLDCEQLEEGENAYIEIVDTTIKTLLIFFTPGPMTGDVIETEVQIPTFETVIVPEVEVEVATIKEANKIIEETIAHSKEILENNHAVFIETECDDSIINDGVFKLCDEDNLNVIELDVISTIPNLSEGDIDIGYSDIPLFSDGEDLCFYPESSNADENGYVKLESGEKYFNIITPVLQLGTLVTDTIPIPENDSDVEGVFVTYGASKESNFFSTITTTISYDLVEGTKTTEVSTKQNYTAFNFEFLFTFKNTVNELKMRALINISENIEIFNFAYPEYDNANYNGQYPEYFHLGTINCSAGNIPNSINISEKRILQLSKKSLAKMGMVPSKLVKAIQENEEANNTLNPCLLPDSIREDNSVVDTSVASKIDAIDNMNAGIAAAIETMNILKQEVQTEDKSDKFQIMEDSNCPLIVLNEQNIMIQVIDKKVQLQLKPSKLSQEHNTYLLDYELSQGEQYMLMYSTVGINFELKLITPNKDIISVKGQNMSNETLQPLFIGGHPDITFCGTTITDIIISNSHIDPITKYIKSVLSYKPRTSEFLFDYKVTWNGLVYNSLDLGFSTPAQRYDYIQNGGINEDGSLISKISLQNAVYVGDIVDNGFFKALRGYSHTFFCSKILTTFGISFWFNPKQVNKELYEEIDNVNRRIILADDINGNYIYHSKSNNAIIIDFANSPIQKINLVNFENKWYNIILNHKEYSRKYEILFTPLNGTTTKLTINSSNKFYLMSVGIEYDYETKDYINEFFGYFANITVFLDEVDDYKYSELLKGQGIQVQGLMIEEEIIDVEVTE